MKLVLDSGEELELWQVPSNIFVYRTMEEVPPLPIEIRTTVTKSSPPPEDLNIPYHPY